MIQSDVRIADPSTFGRELIRGMEGLPEGAEILCLGLEGGACEGRKYGGAAAGAVKVCSPTPTFSPTTHFLKPKPYTLNPKPNPLNPHPEDVTPHPSPLAPKP